MRYVLGLCVIGVLVLTYRLVVSEAGWLLGLCLMGFSLVALMAFFGAIEGLWTTWRRRAFLRSAVGEVIRVEMHYPDFSDSEDSDDPVYTPVVRFKTASGEVKTFTSALSVGSSSKSLKHKVGKTFPGVYTSSSRRSTLSFGSSSKSSKYKVGMTIPVLYDPDDVLPPMIDSWEIIWGGNISVLVFGLVMLGAAAFMVYAVFVLHVLRGRI